MWGSLIALAGLWLFVLEAAREAFLSDRWDSRHYPRFMTIKGLPFWAERRSWMEKREHQRRWHIDLLALMKRRR